MKRIIKQFHPSYSALCSIILIFIVYLVTLCFLEIRGLWITDNADKFLQLRAILDSSYSDFSIPWPGETIDPNFEYNPIPEPFSRVNNHKLFAIFSPVFAAISAFPFRYFGYSGLYILPLLSSLLMLTGLAKIVKDITSEIIFSHCTVLIAGLCTPVWFYSVVFWEHSVAACLCIWAVYFYLRFFNSRSAVHLAIGSMFGTFSIYFRDELYIFCMALVLVMLFLAPDNRRRNVLISIASLGVSILPLWVFQWITIHTPFSYHLSAHMLTVSGIRDHVSTRPEVFYNMFLASHPRRWLSIAFSSPFIIAFFFNPRVPVKAFNFVISVYSLIAIVCSSFYLIGFFFRQCYCVHVANIQ